MLQLIGIKENIDLEKREKLSIIPKHNEKYSKKLLNVCTEVLILSTCNRTEIYIDSNNTSNNIVNDIFNILDWDLNLIEYTFHLKGDDIVANYLMELSCGFYSKILGEDQILGQIKNSYENALKTKTLSTNLQRLFQIAITCGKDFRTKAKLYEIPVSSSSIAIKHSIYRGSKSYMILGYGEVGKLTYKYILQTNFTQLFIAVRNVDSVQINDSRIKVIPFKERKKHYKDADCIISCTSAPHVVISKEDLPDKKIIIYDLAVPRDVENDIHNLKNIELYDIDTVSKIDDKNKKIRENRMCEFKYIIDNYIEDFKNWKCIRQIAPTIKKLKIHGEKIYSRRYTTFVNKKHSKNKDYLAKILLKSTSDAYVNKAITVLKEEQLQGRGEECLRIIEKIFYPQQ